MPIEHKSAYAMSFENDYATASDWLMLPRLVQHLRHHNTGLPLAAPCRGAVAVLETGTADDSAHAAEAPPPMLRGRGDAVRLAGMQNKVLQTNEHHCRASWQCVSQRHCQIARKVSIVMHSYT